MRRREIFDHAADQAARYLDGVGDRPVSVPLTSERLDRWRTQLGRGRPCAESTRPGPWTP